MSSKILCFLGHSRWLATAVEMNEGKLEDYMNDRMIINLYFLMF